MQLENRFTVPVPIDQAWHVLTDIEQVAPCMPGAALDSVHGDEFTGRVKVKLGPINLTYQGHASFVEKDGQAYRAVIDARGKDQRGNGTAAATVTANLKAEGDNTVVDVITDLNITGRPAQFGRGVMTDVGNKLLGQFADKLAAQLGAKPPAEGAAEPAAPPSAAGKAAATAAGAAEEIAASAEQVQGEGAAAQAVKKTAAAAKKGAAAAAEKAAPAKAAPAKAAPAKAEPAKAAPEPHKAVAKKAGAEMLPAEEPAATPAKAAAEAMTGVPAGVPAEVPAARPPVESPASQAQRPGPTRLKAAEPEPIDLLEVAGGATIAKLLAPLVGAIGLVLIIWLIRRRYRN